MLKRNAILKALLIGILASVFLLMLSGTVKATDDDVVWEIGEKGNETWWFDAAGDMFYGKKDGVEWKAVVLTPNSVSERGTVAFSITNAEELKETVELPDKINIPRSIANFDEFVYHIVQFGITETKNTTITGATETAPGITKIILGKYVANEYGTDGSGNSLPAIRPAFDVFTGLTEIEVRSGNENFTSENGVLYNKDKTKLLKFPIAKSTSGFTIPSTVTTIGEYAFTDNKTKETTITIPSSVTTIERYAFSNFDGLTKITFENGDNVTSIGEYAFRECNSLQAFPKLKNLSSVSVGLFYGCGNLTKVELGEKVTSIGNDAFCGAKKLSSINLPNSLTTLGSASGIGSLGKVFNDCEALTALTIPDSVEYIGWASFAECTSLKSVTLPSKLKYIAGHLFEGCTSLTTVNLPADITSIEKNAFRGTKITTIEIPEKVQYIGNSAFENCSNLTCVVVPSSVTKVGTTTDATVFGGANSKLIVYCTASSPIIAKSPAYMVYSKQPASASEKTYVSLDKFTDVKGNITQINPLNIIYGLPVKAIGTSAFEGNTKLTSIIIPDSVTTIGDKAFKGCTGLTEMFIPTEVTTIGAEAFMNCTGMEKIFIPKGSKINSIGTDAFKNCPAIIYYDGNNAALLALAGANSNVQVDNIGPNYTYRGVSYDANKTYAVVTFKFEDAGSGLYKTALSNSSATSGLQWKTMTTSEMKEKVTSNGTVYVHAMDKIGNIASYNIEVTGIDKSAPTVPAKDTSIKITGSTTGATITASVLEEAGGSGLASYIISQVTPANVKNLTTGWKTITGSTTGKVYTITDTNTIKTTGTWYLYVKDKAGNIGNAEIIIQDAHIDTVKPTIEIKERISNINKTHNEVESVSTIFLIKDAGVGLAEYAIGNTWYKINGNPKSLEVKVGYEFPATYSIKAKDAYGNTSELKIEINEIVYDLIAPRVEFGAQSGNKVTVKLVDLFSGLKTGADIAYGWSESNTTEPTSYTSLKGKLNYTAAAKNTSFTADGSTLTGTYYLWIKIVSLSDVDGNETTGSKVSTSTYTFDNTAPKVSKTTVSPTRVKTGNKAIYTITTSENVTLDSSIKPYLTDNKGTKNDNLGTLGSLKGSGTTWTIEVTAKTTEGEVWLVLPAGIFKDNAKLSLAKTEIKGLRIDNSSFTFEQTLKESIDPTVKEEGYTLSKTVIKNGDTAIYSFYTNENIQINNELKSQVTLTGNGIQGTVSDIRKATNGAWDFEVKGGAGDGEVKLNLPAGLFYIETKDNSSGTQQIGGLSFDNTAPTVTIKGPEPTHINKDATAVYTLTASEEIFQTAIINAEMGTSVEFISPILYDESDNIIESANIEVSSKDNKTWEIKVNGVEGDADAKLTIPEGSFSDKAGNNLALTEKTGLTVDNTAPEVTIGEMTLSDDKSSAYFMITTKEKEDSYVISANDTVEKITEEWGKVTSKTFVGAVKSNGDFYVYVKDKAGNITRSDKITISEVVDNIAPTVKIETPKPSKIKSGEKATLKIITSEAVTKVDEIEAIVSGDGNTVELTGDKTNWLATVTAGPSEGEVKLTLPAGIFKDTSGNQLKSAVENSELTIDNTAPEVTVKLEQTDKGIKVTIKANEELSKLEGWTLTKTDKENDTLEKVITEDLAEVTISDIAGNEIVVPTKVKFASSIALSKTATTSVGAKQKLALTTTPSDATLETIKWTTSNKNIVTVDENGTIKGIAVGTANITATSISNSKVTATCAVTVNAKIDVTEVTFKTDAPKELTLGDTQDLSKYITVAPANASITDVEWSSDNTSVIKISEDGVVTAVGKGTANITVKTLDGEKTAKITITVKEIPSTAVTGVNLNKKEIRLVKGNTETLNATVTPNNVDSSLQAVVWSSSNEAIATVNNGVVTAIGKGEATITVTTINGGKTATCKVYVEDEMIPLEKIAFDKTSVSIVEGESKTLKVNFTPSNAINQNVSFKSNDETIATVDGEGIVTALTPGTTTIIATSEEGNFEAVCTITVTKLIPVTEIKLNKTSMDLKIGEEETLNATVTPSDATYQKIIWASDNTKVATVNDNGKVTATGIGEATIIATSQDGKIHAECKIIVANKVSVTDVTLNKTTMNLTKGDEATLIATVNPSDAANKNITWKSDNEKVATVTAEGKVTAIGDGTAIITVTTEDGNKTSTCTVTVTTGTGKVTGVTLNAKTMTLPVGAVSKLVATVEPSDAANKELNWTTSNESVIIVDTEGNITAVAEGIATITVTTVDGNMSASCMITVVEKATGFNDEASFGMKTVDGITYLVGINPETAIQSIIDCLAEGYTAVVQDNNGKTITDYTELASTDRTRIIVTGAEGTITYIVVVKGDCTGDGRVTANDLIDAVKQFKYTRSDGKKGTKLEGAKLLAIKFTDKEEYTASDLISEVKMYKEWRINN